LLQLHLLRPLLRPESFPQSRIDVALRGRRSRSIVRGGGTRIAKSTPATMRIFSFFGMRARRSVLLNCLRSFAQISLCDAQSAVPLKIIFRGSRALDRVRAGRQRIACVPRVRCIAVRRHAKGMHKTRHFFVIAKNKPRIACIDLRFGAHLGWGCKGIRSRTGR